MKVTIRQPKQSRVLSHTESGFANLPTVHSTGRGSSPGWGTSAEAAVI